MGGKEQEKGMSAREEDDTGKRVTAGAREIKIRMDR